MSRNRVAEGGRQLETPRVLVVDDDRDATSSLAALLTDLGCDVSYTFDPRLALALGRKCKPHVAFLDLRMPHLTGFHLASAFRAEKDLAGCALIALSGYCDLYRDAVQQSVFDGLLDKPASLDEIAGTIMRFAGAAERGLAAAQSPR